MFGCLNDAQGAPAFRCFQAKIVQILSLYFLSDEFSHVLSSVVRCNYEIFEIGFDCIVSILDFPCRLSLAHSRPPDLTRDPPCSQLSALSSSLCFLIMVHYPDEIEYSEKYQDDQYEYRHVLLNKARNLEVGQAHPRPNIAPSCPQTWPLFKEKGSSRTLHSGSMATTGGYLLGATRVP